MASQQAAPMREGRETVDSDYRLTRSAERRGWIDERMGHVGQAGNSADQI
jgi:hypothetical protein